MAASFRNSKKTTSFKRTIIQPVGLCFCASFLALVTPASSARPSPNLEDRELETLSRRYEVDLSTKALRLNLKEIASLSFKQNPRLPARQLDQRSQEWKTIQLRREWLPELGLNAFIGRGRRIETIDSTRSDGVDLFEFNFRDSGSFYPSAYLDWSLINLSRTSRLKASKAGVRSRSLLTAQEGRDLLLSLQSTYYSLQTLRQLEVVIHDLYKLCRQIIAESPAEDRSDSPNNITDSLTTKALELHTQRIRTQQEVIRASAMLAQLAGLPGDAFILPKTPLKPSAPWSHDLASSLKLATQQRESIQIASSRADQYAWTASAAENRYFPELYLEAYASVWRERYSLTETNKLDIVTADGISSEQYVGFGISWPLFDSGVNSAAATAGRLQAAAEQERMRQQQLIAAQQVKTAYAKYTAQLILKDNTRDQLRSAERALTGARQHYQKDPSRAVTTLIQAIDLYLSAYRDVLDNTLAFNTAVAQLHRYTSTWPEHLPSMTQQH